MLLASDWGVGQVFVSLVWFFLFVIWLMLIFRVFADLFASHDLGGFAKVVWAILVIVLPFVGVFVYLIVRGSGMAQRDDKAYEQREAERHEYIRRAAGSPGSTTTEDLERLASLHDRGKIDDAEFATLKAKLLG